MLDILDFDNSPVGLGPPVPAQRNSAGHPACCGGLRGFGRPLPSGGSPLAVPLDEQALAPDGQRGTAGDLRTGLPVFPGNGCVRSVSEFPSQRPRRQLI